MNEKDPDEALYRFHKYTAGYASRG